MYCTPDHFTQRNDIEYNNRIYTQTFQFTLMANIYTVQQHFTSIYSHMIVSHQ